MDGCVIGVCLGRTPLMARSTTIGTSLFPKNTRRIPARAHLLRDDVEWVGSAHSCNASRSFYAALCAALWSRTYLVAPIACCRSQSPAAAPHSSVVPFVPPAAATAKRVPSKQKRGGGTSDWPMRRSNRYFFCAARVGKWHRPADFRAAAISSGIGGTADRLSALILTPRFDPRPTSCSCEDCGAASHATTIESLVLIE
jgi:hypothetical protein